MTNLLKKNEKGFTLIEVVLVLAIAGLLLVVVFMAVAGAQKSRRDSQRKEDISRVAAALESYASNNNGDYPTTAAKQTAFTTAYVSDIQKPNGGAYTYTWATATTDPTTIAQDTIVIGINGRQYNACVGLDGTNNIMNCRKN